MSIDYNNNHSQQSISKSTTTSDHDSILNKLHISKVNIYNPSITLLVHIEEGGYNNNNKDKQNHNENLKMMTSPLFYLYEKMISSKLKI